ADEVGYDTFASACDETSYASMEPGNVVNNEISNTTNAHTSIIDENKNGSKQPIAEMFKKPSPSKAARLTTMTSEHVQHFKNTLYGYFIGKRLAFPLVENYVKNAWAKFGLERVMLTNGFFFFQFASREGMERVLKNGPWLIRLVPIILNIWTSNTRFFTPRQRQKHGNAT
ncbi:zinc knuckle CX2CX4HX4C containing protein, partial [Tanacetum coccineum]